ncbi:MAG: hypothetical protein JXR94_23525 [Candidatus Hydrogenedentes bacterium]|nr:hypothetical protein [Candidatus Hydrogenedentota bacterium]
MIRINLLPYHLRPVKHSPIPYILSACVLVGAILYMLSVFFANATAVQRKRDQLAQHQAEFDQYKSIVEESNFLEQRKIELALKIQTIDSIVSDRIIWSRQLWNLSRLVPENMWYSDIRTETKTFRVQRSEIDPNTKKPVKKMVDIKRAILRVKGYVIEDDAGEKSVNPLMDAVTGDDDFASMFELQPSSFTDTEFEEVPVRSFNFEFLIVPGGANR